LSIILFSTVLRACCAANINENTEAPADFGAKVPRRNLKSLEFLNSSLVGVNGTKESAHRYNVDTEYNRVQLKYQR
jgi:hypothetical protein